MATLLEDKRLDEQCWAVRGAKGTPHQVMEGIRAIPLPDWTKPMLISAIESSHGQAALIRVDAHWNVYTNADGRTEAIGNFHITDL